MRQVKLAQHLKMSESKLRYLTSEELKRLGWLKIGKGKGCFYRRTAIDADVPEEEKESTEEARRRKTIAEANLLEWKGGKLDAELKRKGAEEFFDAVSEVLSVLPSAYARCKLTPDQNRIINEAYGSAIKGLDAVKSNLG